MFGTVKRVGDGAAGVARGGDEDGQRIVAAVAGRHQPRHHPRTDVLERERRAVKQLERVDARAHFDERNRKVQRLDDDGFERGGIEIAARERPERAQGDLGQRAARQPCDLVVAPRLDRFGNVEAAVGREPGEERGRE